MVFMFDQEFFIYILDDDNLNDPSLVKGINLDNYDILENVSGAEIANILGFDENGNELSFELKSSAYRDWLEIENNVLKLKDGIEVDYELLEIIDVNIRGTDSEGAYKDQLFEIQVLDDLSDNPNSNQAPTSISLDASSVIENDFGGHIANISGEDPDDDSLTYSVLSGQDSGLIEIDGTTVKFKDGVSADYEQDQSLEFTLRATDPDDLYKDQSFSLNVLDDTSDNNQAPTSISLDASSVTENDVGGHIANITGEDPDGDSLTYSVLPGQDSSLVEVDGTTVKFKDGVSADYEQDQSLEFTLRATDPDDLYKDQAFTLNVLDDISDNNKAPTSISLDASSVPENLSGGHIANITGEDPDGDSLTYSVLPGQDSSLVEVDGTTVKFKNGVSADYEQDQSLEFTLRAKDPDGLYVDKSEFNISVFDDVFDNFNGNTISLNNKSLLFYGRHNPIEDFNVNNLDVFGVLIDKSTGEFIGLIIPNIILNKCIETII